MHFGALDTSIELENLARSFVKSKDGDLAAEAGGCAIYLLAESCYLRYGDERWKMEANKLWRSCAKKAKARRNVAQSRLMPDDFFFAKEICKRAQRLVPGPPSCQRLAAVLSSTAHGQTACKMLVGDGERGCEDNQEQPTHSPTQMVSLHETSSSKSQQASDYEEFAISSLEWHKVSEPSECSQPEAEVEVMELRGELRRLKQQLSRQARHATAREVEIQKLRKSKHKLLKMTCKAEAHKIQALWRRAIARSTLAPLKTQALREAAATILQANYRCRRVARHYEAVSWNRILRAARAIQSLSSYSQMRNRACAKRQIAATRLQAILRGAVKTRVRRLKHARVVDKNHLVVLAASDATINTLNEELNLLHALYAVGAENKNVA
mmetsp:Transcript_22949/g.70990  ORF Transcript_22949/g.70990 Transcript_22949/m.70990 type:complete len:382 (+) Transcript_22949:247-1392(+)